MRRNQKGWEELRKRLQNADIPPPYPSWEQFHQSMQNKDSWHYIGRKMRAYEHTPPNYVKQRIFYSGAVVRYSPVPVLLIGLIIGLLAGLLMTNKNSLYSLFNYNPDYITHFESDHAYPNQNSQVANLVENRAIHPTQTTEVEKQPGSSTFKADRQVSGQRGNHPALLAQIPYSPNIEDDNTLTPDGNAIQRSDSEVSSAMNPLSILPVSLEISHEGAGQISKMGIGEGKDVRNNSSLPLITEVHGGINLSRLAAISGNGFSNKVLPGFHTSLLIGIPVYKGNVLYLALNKTHSRVSISIEGREYYNHIDGTSLEIGGISRTGFVLNGKPFYVRYGLMWTQFHGKGLDGVVGAGYSPGGIIAIRRFNGTLGRRFIWGWEGGMSMLFKDVAGIDGVQLPVNFYISTIISFKM